MKIVLDLKLDGQPKENDIIIFQNGNWKVITKESFFAKHINDNRQSFAAIERNEKKLEEKIGRLQKDLVALAKIVKEK